MLRRRTIFWILAFAVMLVAATGVLVFSNSSPDKNLSKYHEVLLERYPEVTHITTEAFAILPKDDVILFDVRERAEFDVSHLQSAINVSPSMSALNFLENYEDQIEGKKVVFYCSVGERSSNLAQAVLAELNGASGVEVLNLEKGIFNWHNQQREVFNAHGATEKIHPFSKFWGRLLLRSDQFELN